MNRMRNVPWILWAGMLGLILCVPSGCNFFYPPGSESKELEHIANSTNNYRDTFKKYPPVIITDNARKPLHSWRAVIAPQIMVTSFWDSYDLSSAWNSETNKGLAEGAREIIRDDFVENLSLVGEIYVGGDGSKTWNTKFVLVVDGPLEPAPFLAGSRFKDLTGHYLHADQSFIILELKESDIHWMEPRDITTDGVFDASWPRLDDWKDRIVRSAELMGGETTIRDRKETLTLLDAKFGG